jgi:hypothetical protein
MSDGTYTFSPNVHLNGGTVYYFGFTSSLNDPGHGGSGGAVPMQVHTGLSNWSGGATQGQLFLTGSNGNLWTSLNVSSIYGVVSIASDLVSNSGTWTSATYDSQSDSSAPTSFTQTGSYPSLTGGTTFLEGSNDQSNWDVSTSIVNGNGTTAESLSSRRYWRVRSVLATFDDTITPTMGGYAISFPTSSVWISPAIDHTADITALNTLTFTSSVPSGTSVTVQIATSSDNISYSSYVTVGSATPLRYSKVKVSMTSDTTSRVTPTVNNVILAWTVASSQTSGAVDTSNTPVGWELFQTAVGSLGTATFQVRTAATSGGLGAAGWVTVTNGTYITATVLRFIQWKAVLTSTSDNVATVDSVTINWFISKTNSIRVASIFYGRAYYLAAAEFGNTTNNIVFKLDEFNQWRVYRGLSIGTLTLFFNQPYYGSGTVGQIVKWLTSTTDSGTNIALDVQTAAVNYEDLGHSKILRKVRFVGKNTGATYTPQYSTDVGLTWKSLINPNNGSSTFTTTSDGGLFNIHVQPVFASDNATGITHIIRLQNSDAYACEIHSIKMDAFIRQGDL